MPALSPFERRAIATGVKQQARESILTAVEVHFGHAPQALQDALNKINSVPVLNKLHRTAMTAGSLEYFEREPGLSLRQSRTGVLRRPGPATITVPNPPNGRQNVPP